MAKILLGGFLATVLLGLYFTSIIFSVQRASLCGVKDSVIAADTKASTAAFAKQNKESGQTDEQAANDVVKVLKESCTDEQKNLGNLSYLLNLLGGLISATVVAGLAATTTDELPGKDLFKNGQDGIVRAVAAYLPVAYIVVWTSCGVLAVIYGLMLYGNDPSPPLTAHAKAWLGTAVAAIYAYFGITPEGASVMPAIADIAIEPASLTLDETHSSERLTATATDAQNNPIPGLPSERFLWKSSNPNFATVDQTGLVTRVAAGNCKITATANSITSNDCAVACS